ncbi:MULTISPECIES: histidine phosphatase family protein [Pseudomonadati]|uniref:Histidine phosphatase family protein n=1 Tax=Shewanella aestuarii TaxID=1028752 RepID=A0ABT0L0R5_9GAMM|nr:histidine phosphatase family protein [Shewanella aestuarii]MCL1116836.1 histidine phosphatase family protein [Shewanella aestuarii]GGN73460.1 phosphoglycerate mutase [Shewanella aestuarii]
MKHLQLVFLRHGHCQGGDILRGKTNVPLSENGLIQMQQAFASLLTLPDVVYSSSLKRCLQFSDLIAKQHQLPIKVLDGLQEIDFGEWDGQTWQTLYQKHEPQLTEYWSNPWDIKHTPPKAEYLGDFSARVQAAVSQIIWQMLQRSAAEPESYKEDSIPSALIVTHGGVMRCIMAAILGVEQAAGIFSQFHLPYAALFHVDVFVDGQYLENVDQDTFAFKNLSVRLNWPALSDSSQG